MKTPFFVAAFIAVSTLAALGYASSAMAYGIGGAVLDAPGNNASATDLASVNCPQGTDHFSAAVQDNSAPVNGLYVSAHIFKGQQMTTVTAPTNGGWSDIVSVYGGAGTYYLSVRKTNVGARAFTVGWDCRDANNVSTGTDLKVLQVQ
ncbi:MAG: hypothetical protein ACOYMG_09780 [Candidatus Methylumidiphilus sp.]